MRRRERQRQTLERRVCSRGHLVIEGPWGLRFSAVVCFESTRDAVCIFVFSSSWKWCIFSLSLVLHFLAMGSSSYFWIMNSSNKKDLLSLVQPAALSFSLQGWQREGSFGLACQNRGLCHQSLSACGGEVWLAKLASAKLLLRWEKIIYMFPSSEIGT